MFRQTFDHSSSQAHTCLDPFKAQPGLVRNFRILWNSMPTALRREALTRMFRESIDSHASRNDLANWAMSYKVLGQSVCKDAFMTITGISAWALTDARNAAQKGHQSSLGAAELGTGALLKNTNKELVYIGCRAWLENYAATHAEMSPHSCEAVLPWGRKEFCLFPIRARKAIKKIRGR